MLIDANIFLEVLLNQKKVERCKQTLRNIQMGTLNAWLSTFTIDAIILIMARYNAKARVIEKFLKSLPKYKGLKLYNITYKDRIDSLKLMEHYKLDYEDAITLQSAFSSKSKEILSFDKHFDGIKGINRIEP